MRPDTRLNAPVWLCLGWTVATTLALLIPVLLDPALLDTGSWSGSIILLGHPILLGAFEGAVFALSVYHCSKDTKTSRRSGLLWGLSVALGFLIWPVVFMTISRYFAVLLFIPAWVLEQTGLPIFPLGWYLGYQLTVGLMQVPLMGRVSHLSWPWIGVRMLALTLAIAVVTAATGYTPDIYTGGPVISLNQALIMGIVGGLVKGWGFVLLLRRRKTPSDVLRA